VICGGLFLQVIFAAKTPLEHNRKFALSEIWIILSLFNYNALQIKSTVLYPNINL